MCQPRKLCQYVSYQFLSQIAIMIFLKFHMKLEGLKGQKLTGPNISKKFAFWRKNLQIAAKQGFLAFTINIIY